MSSAPNTMPVKGFTGENTGPKPWARGTGGDRNEVRQRELEDGNTKRQNNREIYAGLWSSTLLSKEAELLS